jgi:hypothetical protein
VAVIATIVVNGLANALPLNGLNTGEISDRFQVYFVPAGYVFSIWGLIYLGLILFAVASFLPSLRGNPRLARIGPWFVVSCVANVAWLVLWHYEVFLWTVLAMLTLLISLIVIYQRLDIGRSSIGPAERWMIHLPFSLYLGWVTVATIANVTAVLDFVQWNGWGIAAETWAVVMILTGAAVAALVTLTRRDVVFPLVVVWALIGIAAKNPDTAAVLTAAWVGVAVVLVAIVVGLLRRRGATPLPAAAL